MRLFLLKPFSRFFPLTHTLSFNPNYLCHGLTITQRTPSQVAGAGIGDFTFLAIGTGARFPALFVKFFII